jgi:secondary thiamine-phosphate synthase enzyme
MIDITDRIKELVIGAGFQDGVCHIFVPHTTAGITINENADPDVQTDILLCLRNLIPISSVFRHFEGNSDAHVKALLVGHATSVIVQTGQLQLGTWQSIFFCEFDGPRQRTVFVQLIASTAC